MTEAARNVVRIETYKAQSGPDSVPDLEIVATDTTPGFDTLELQRECYRRDAELIVAALVRVLPGGLVDQILVALLAGRASYFQVPWIS